MKKVLAALISALNLAFLLFSFSASAEEPNLITKDVKIKTANGYIEKFNWSNGVLKHSDVNDSSSMYFDITTDIKASYTFSGTFKINSFKDPSAWYGPRFVYMSDMKDKGEQYLSLAYWQNTTLQMLDYLPTTKGNFWNPTYMNVKLTLGKNYKFVIDVTPDHVKVTFDDVVRYNRNLETFEKGMPYMFGMWAINCDIEVFNISVVKAGASSGSTTSSKSNNTTTSSKSNTTTNSNTVDSQTTLTDTSASADTSTTQETIIGDPSYEQSTTSTSKLIDDTTTNNSNRLLLPIIIIVASVVIVAAGLIVYFKVLKAKG